MSLQIAESDRERHPARRPPQPTHLLAAADRGSGRGGSKHAACVRGFRPRIRSHLHARPLNHSLMRENSRPQVCGDSFASKNKLFAHLRASSACAGRVPRKAAAADAGPAPCKKAKSAPGCGVLAAGGARNSGAHRVQVSLATLDADIEPDGCLLEEKLRLIQLAGIETANPVFLCGCGGAAEGAGGVDLPRDVLRAMRILVMTETEVYFAGGPDAEAWARSDCVGMSARNEIRALHHLRKQLRANDVPFKAKRLCRQGLLDEVDRRLRAVFADNLPRQRGSPLPDDAARASAAAFESWAEAHGMSSGLTVRQFPGTGRGMAARGALKAGDVVVRVPANLFLNTEAVSSSRFASVMQAIKGVDERAQHLLLLLLEDLHRPSSPWKEYLAACPQHFTNALSLSTDHLRVLEGSPALECIVAHRQEHAALYAALFPPLSERFPAEFPAAACTWERFAWAASMIDSRAWATEAGCEVASLVPGADMLNHHMLNLCTSPYI